MPHPPRRHLRRSFDDVERAAQPGGPLAEGGEAPIGTEARFSLEHREDLLEGTREWAPAGAAGLQASDTSGLGTIRLVGLGLAPGGAR